MKKIEIKSYPKIDETILKEREELFRQKNDGVMEIAKLIDKITEQQKGVENDSKTLLGVDNQGGYLNREQQNLDTTNSNNDEINDMSNGSFKELQKHLDRANKILGLNIHVKQTSQPVTQIGIKKEQINGKDDLPQL